MWHGNAFGRICLSVCLSCSGSNFGKPWPRNFIIGTQFRLFRMSGSCSYIEVIGSRSRSQLQNEYLCHFLALTLEHLDLEISFLASRCIIFKRSVLPESSCLHYLLPDKRDTSVTGRLRHARTFEPLTTRTVKFRNYIHPVLSIQFWLSLHYYLDTFMCYSISCIMYCIILLPVIIQPLAALW